MLHLIPAPLHRAALCLAHRLRKLWWRWRKPELLGCSIVLRDSTDRILLVRHSYGSGLWGLPGGALKQGEDAVQAIIRELREETGCRAETVAPLGEAVHDFHGAYNRVWMFVGRTDDTPVPDGREILEARFFAFDGLPENLSPRAAEWLDRVPRNP